MATPQIHIRSISLPTRLNSTSFKTQLQKLKSFPLISSQAIQSGLLGLSELYISVDELTRSSSRHQDAKSMEDRLEGSIELLDCCSSIRELFQLIKENVQTLQSALRRKGLDSSIQSDVATYACSRKKMNKCIAKTLKTLKKLEQENTSGDINLVTITILKSVIMFLSCPNAKSNNGAWSLVSNMMMKKSMACGRDHSVINEVDLALNAIKNGDYKVIDLQRRLQNLEACVEGIEEGLERLFRQLVQCRVTLLNILTDHF